MLTTRVKIVALCTTGLLACDSPLPQPDNGQAGQADQAGEVGSLQQAAGASTTTNVNVVGWQAGVNGTVGASEVGTWNVNSTIQGTPSIQPAPNAVFNVQQAP